MITQKGKIKEMAEFLIKNNSETQCLVFKNPNYKPVGVSEVITCEYSVKDMRIVYNEWFVEGFELAQQMNLPGTEHHGNLVKGSGVTITTKNRGPFIYYGKDALSIKNACEINRDLSSYLLSGNQR